MSADVLTPTPQTFQKTTKTTTTYPASSYTSGAVAPGGASASVSGSGSGPLPGDSSSTPLLSTTTTTTTTTTKKVPSRSPWHSLSHNIKQSLFGPSSTFRRHQQRWVLGATVLGLSLLVALTAMSLSRAIGTGKHAMEYAGDKARMAYDRYQPSQLDQMGDQAAHLRQQGEQWADQARLTGKHWWSKWSPWLDSAEDKMQQGNEMARKKLLEPEHEGMFMRAYHYLFSRSEADEAAIRARQYANEARDAIRPTVWERMKHALGQSSPEEQLKFFAESGIDEAGNIIDRAKFDTWEAKFNEIKQQLQHEPTLYERMIQHLYPTPTAEELKESAKEKAQEYYDQAREAAHPTLWARFKNAFGQASPVERAQILASAGLDESGKIVDRAKFQAYQSYLYAKDRAQLFADETKARLHPSLWARVKHAMGKASPSEMAQIYAVAGLDEAGNIIDQAKFTAWETATRLKAASMDVLHDLAQRADRLTRPPTLWERFYYTFHHEPTWNERAHDMKQSLDEYYDRTKDAIHPSLWARFKHAFGASSPTERAQIYAAAGLDEAGNIVDKVKFQAYQTALKARDTINVYADKTQQSLHPSAWARFKNLFGQATPLERAQIYASAGLDEMGNIVDKTKFTAWEQGVKLRGAAYDVAHNLRDTLYPQPTLWERFRNTFIHEPTTTERAQDLAARSWYATRDAAQQAYEQARHAMIHEPTLGERISGLFYHKPTATERAQLYAEQMIQNAQDAALAAKEKLYPEPTLGQKIRHLFVRDDTPAERARYLAAAGLDQAGNIIDKAKFSAWEQALKIKAAAYDATHPTVWERTKAVFVEPSPSQKAKLYAGQVWDSTSDAYDTLKHKYVHEPTMWEKMKDYVWHEPTYTERARDYVYDTFYHEPTFGERIASAFSNNDIRPRVASSLHDTADSLRTTEPSMTERMKQAAKEKVADVLDHAGNKVHHEPTLTERAQDAAQKIRDTIVGPPPSESTYDKIKSAVLPDHDQHIREQEKEALRKKAHEAIDKSMK